MTSLTRAAPSEQGRSVPTQGLAAYLRFLLQPAAVLEPLSRELDALEEYFTIQEVRFGDGFFILVFSFWSSGSCLAISGSIPPNFVRHR